jgi:hypothetical protein
MARLRSRPHISQPRGYVVSIHGCMTSVKLNSQRTFSIQPPGALHLVFTPRACVASGGHFYNYDSLHLTEWTRRIQHFQSNAVTNQNPARVKELLNLMMLNFANMRERGISTVHYGSSSHFGYSLLQACCGGIVQDGVG